MTQEPTVTPGAPAGRPTLKQDIAAGTSIGAGILLVTVGILQLLQGISAVVNDELFVSGVQYIYKFDFTGWGWIQLIIGIVMAIVAVGLFTGNRAARWLAVGMAMLSALAQFGIISAFPLWAILVIVLDVVVIYQLVVRWEPEV